MKQIIVILLIFLIAGCSFRTLPKNGQEIEIINGERIYTKSGSISATASNNDSKVPFLGYTRFDYDFIDFERHIPNMMSENVSISVSAIPQNEVAKIGMLHKDESDTMEEYYKSFKMSDWEKKNNAERGVQYTKNYVDFIGGLKCGTRVESSNIALGVGTKSYQTSCYYFDNQQGAKFIHLNYRYTYSHSGTKHEDDTKSSTVTPEAMQNQFKQDIKAIFDSLVIHDMDRERMAKEGLLHNRKYEIQEW